MVNDVRKVERLTRDTGVIVIRAVKFRHRFCFNDMACYICTVVYGNLIGGGGGEIRSARGRFELEIYGLMRAFFVSVVSLIY